MQARVGDRAGGGGGTETHCVHKADRGMETVGWRWTTVAAGRKQPVDRQDHGRQMGVAGVAGAMSAQRQWDGWGWDTEKINDIVIST